MASLELKDLLVHARNQGASDIHITAGHNPIFRIDGSLIETDISLSTEEKVSLIYAFLEPVERERIVSGQDVDKSYSLDGGLRHRVNIFRQQKRLAASIRIINESTPTFEQLALPEVLRTLVDEPRGLILVTGPTGSGKSTTLAAMVDYINATRPCHILTIEDPVEYLYKKKKALIHQRDVGLDVKNFSTALRSAMREDPDVILVGEMRDYETIAAAVTAAETGHLVLSTLHTTGAAMTIDRIVDVFPPHNQQQIRTQLASVLKGVITQTLVPKASGHGRVAAFEIMLGSDAVLSLIRENKGHQLNATIQTGTRQGMVLLDTYLAGLVRSGVITYEAAMERANNKAALASELRRI